MAWWRSKGQEGGPPGRPGAWLGLLLLPALALAQPHPPAASPEVRVIVDVSGSMRSNDPEQLAASAVELLAALLPDGVTAGVWTFGETVAAPLPLAEVDDAWREQAMALRPALVEYQPFTDIEAAVAAAAEPSASLTCCCSPTASSTFLPLEAPSLPSMTPPAAACSRRWPPTSPARGWWPTPSPSPRRLTWRWWPSFPG